MLKFAQEVLFVFAAGIIEIVAVDVADIVVVVVVVVVVVEFSRRLSLMLLSFIVAAAAFVQSVVNCYYFSILRHQEDLFVYNTCIVRKLE